MTDFTSDAQDAQPPLPTSRVLVYLARQWRRRPVMFSVMATCSALGTVADVFIPVAAGGLVDALASAPEDRAEAGHWLAYLIFISAALAVAGFRQAGIRCEMRFSTANMADIVSEAFAKVQRFSLDWHANTFAGSIVRKVTRGMWAYDSATAMLWFGVIPSVSVMVGLCLYMLFTWPLVGLYALTIVIGFMIGSIWLSVSYVRPQNIRSNTLDSELGGAVADSVGSIATVKSFGAEARELDRFRDLAWRWREQAKRTWLRFANVWLFQQACVFALQAGLTGFLISMWQRGEATPGAVVFAITAFLTMAGYMRRFGDEVQQVQRGLDEMQDLARFEDTLEQVADPRFAPAFKRGPGAVEFDRVTFGYDNAAGPLYRDFSLKIAPGESVALVGPTGAGKSTFVKLLQRFYDVQDGAVRIDGQDVRSVTQASLRAAIALVPQDPALFHRTIGENIAYARPGASPEDIVEAARRARAHDFIAALPKGYDTLVGERGVKLSGGERQRVAIARAILADAPILVLDEATSSLDNETEREVQAAMAELMRGRTAIVIAHRLSTIKDADRILVFDQGRIVEQGRHADLAARNDGLYARLAALAQA